MTAMSKSEAIGPKAADSAEWNHAWSVVSQLAAARGATLRELGPNESNESNGAAPEPPIEAKSGAESAAAEAAPLAPVVPGQLARDMAEIERAAAALRELGPDESNGTVPEPAIEAKTGAESAAVEPAPLAPVVPDQLARDVAEIERAAAALRRAEPTLERRAPSPPVTPDAPAAGSVWPLLGVIWLMAAGVVSCAIAAVVLFFG
jgi:hypothetical protein